MADKQERAHEARARRAVRRHGCELEKSRSRNPALPDFGTYWIVNPCNNTIVASSWPPEVGLTLDEVEAWLAEPVTEHAR